MSIIGVYLSCECTYMLCVSFVLSIYYACVDTLWCLYVVCECVLYVCISYVCCLHMLSE